MALREKSELMSMGVGSREAVEPKRKSPCDLRHKGLSFFGGDGGIRTLDTLLAYAPLAGEYLRPLGHISSTASILAQKTHASPGAGIKNNA